MITGEATEPELPLAVGAEIASTGIDQIALTAADIPGAILNLSFLSSYTVPELRWWLLCRGISVPTTLNKKHLVERY